MIRGQRTEDRTVDKFTKFEGCDSVTKMFAIDNQAPELYLKFESV